MNPALPDFDFDYNRAMNKKILWHRLRARFFMFIDQRAKAGNELETLLMLDHSDTAAKKTLGVLYGEAGKLALAAEQFQSAINDEPYNAGTLFNLGFIQQKQDAHTEAIQSFSEALRLTPSLDRAWFGRGMSRAALGQHELAIEDFEHAAKLQPMNPHALLELGMQYHLTNNKKQVIATIRRLREFDPKATRELMQATHTVLDIEES